MVYSPSFSFYSPFSLQSDPLAAHTVKTDTDRAETTAAAEAAGTVVATATTAAAAAAIVNATAAGTGTGTVVVAVVGATGTAATDTAEAEVVADGSLRTTGATQGTTTTAVAVTSAATTNSGLRADKGKTGPRAAATVVAVAKAGMGWVRPSAARPPQTVPRLCRRGNARPRAGTSMRLAMSNTPPCRLSRLARRDPCSCCNVY